MTFSRLSVVFMKCKADKSEHHQDGSSYYQPMRIFHAEPPSRSSFLRLQPELDHALRPPNIAGFRPSIAGVADFVSKSIASLEAVRRNAGVLQRSVCRNISGPPASSWIKPKPRSTFHIFKLQHSSRPRLFPLRLEPELDQAADGFGAVGFVLLGPLVDSCSEFN